MRGSRISTVPAPIANDEGAELSWRLAEQNAAQACRWTRKTRKHHAAMAQIKLMHDWDSSAAREHTLRALQLNPSLPEAHEVYARYLRVAGNHEEAVSHRTLLKGVPSHEPGLLQIHVDPDFDLIRDDPRCAELLRQIGFPSE